MSGHIHSKQFQVRQVSQLHGNHILCDLPVVYTFKETDIILRGIAGLLAFCIGEVTIANKVHSLLRMVSISATENIFKRTIIQLFGDPEIGCLKACVIVKVSLANIIHFNSCNLARFKLQVNDAALFVH